MPRNLHGNGIHGNGNGNGNGNVNGNGTKLLETDAILLRTFSGFLHFVNTPSYEPPRALPELLQTLPKLTQASQSLFWARPGPGGDWIGFGGGQSSQVWALSAKKSFLALIPGSPGSPGSRGSPGSGVRKCGSDPTFHTRGGPG